MDEVTIKITIENIFRVKRNNAKNKIKKKEPAKKKLF